MHMVIIGLVTFFFYDRSVGFPGAKHHKKSLIWGSLLDVNCVSVIICWEFQQAIIEVVKIRVKDQRAKKLGVPPRTLWSNDQDPVLLVVIIADLQGAKARVCS